MFIDNTMQVKWYQVLGYWIEETLVGIYILIDDSIVIYASSYVMCKLIPKIVKETENWHQKKKKKRKEEKTFGRKRSEPVVDFDRAGYSASGFKVSIPKDMKTFRTRNTEIFYKQKIKMNENK